MKNWLLVRAPIFLVLSLCVSVASSVAQEIESLKKGVVKITVKTLDDKQRLGTGFIVKVDADVVYIVTAAHVVQGAREIEVEFFTRRNRAVPAKVNQMEEGETEGLATLSVREKPPSDLTVLKLNSSVRVRNEDAVTTIGFPRNIGVPWATIRGNIVGSKGKLLTFSGPGVDEGNSGGPLIKEGQVVGVVTAVASGIAYAIRATVAQITLEGWGVEIEEIPADNSRSREPAPSSSSKRLPTADEILDKYVEALGGKAAFEKIFSLMATGTFEGPALRGTVESFRKAPNKALSHMEFPGLGVVTEGFNGVIAWETSPLTGARELSGIELGDAKRQATFNYDIKLKELFPKRTLTGIQNIGTRLAYVLELSSDEGSPVTSYFDTQSGLLLRQIWHTSSPGRPSTDMYLEDYREVNGIKFPFTVRFSGIGTTIKLVEIKVNVPINNIIFERPTVP